ncbi:MAG TPA: universal stress protein [Candidatus Angelobacter sp.]|nr:universal stress protein [Candidatus Angelobacter sp.]
MATAEVISSSVGIHRLLIATDFSHQSDEAVKYGLDFARLFGAQAEIAYVLPTEDYAMAGPEGVMAGREACRRDLLELKSRLRRGRDYDDDTEEQVTLLEGPVAECLLQCARHNKIDLIVVGTHGRGGLGKILLGSVAEKVFRHSPVPVLTIGPNIHRIRRWNSVHEVLAPCDLTPKSRPAVRYACELARAHASRLTVLTVVEGTNADSKDDVERVKNAIWKQLSDIVGVKAGGLEISCRVEFGRVAPTILGVASELKAELIVLGVRPSSGVLDRFQWPVAYELIRAATCPVLTIRGGAPAH